MSCGNTDMMNGRQIDDQDSKDGKNDPECNNVTDEWRGNGCKRQRPTSNGNVGGDRRILTPSHIDDIGNKKPNNLQM